ncbi:MAG: polysaccharide biosynthesis/export family protein [Myxococcota bacterium]
MAALCVVSMGGCPKPTGPVVLPPPKAAPKSDAVRAGDKLSITVRGQEDLSGEYMVSADGLVRFPRIGDVPASEREPADVAKEIETSLADGWLRDPQVTVSLLERQNPEQVTVLGEVEAAGSYPHDGQLTLMKAISLAGGMSDTAQQRKVKLIRETEAGRKTVEIDVQAIVESRAQDVPIEPGDIIMVPESPI